MSTIRSILVYRNLSTDDILVLFRGTRQSVLNQSDVDGTIQFLSFKLQFN